MQVLLGYMQVLLAYMQVLLAYMQQKFKIVCNVTDLQEAYKHLCSPYVLTELHVTYIQCLPTVGIKTIAFNIHIFPYDDVLQQVAKSSQRVSPYHLQDILSARTIPEQASHLHPTGPDPRRCRQDPPGLGTSQRLCTARARG